MSAAQQYQELLKELGTLAPHDTSTLLDINGRAYLPKHKPSSLKNIVAVGECVGVKGKQFKPSTHTLQLLNETCTKKTIVNEKGEFLVTCSRDAWKENIISTTCREGERTLILNTRNEVIGLGWFRNKKVETTYDIGDYLRREKLSSKRRKH